MLISITIKGSDAKKEIIQRKLFGNIDERIAAHCFARGEKKRGHTKRGLTF